MEFKGRVLDFTSTDTNRLLPDTALLLFLLVDGLLIESSSDLQHVVTRICFRVADALYS